MFLLRLRRSTLASECGVPSVVAIGLLLLCSSGARAATVMLAWNPNPESNIAGYIVSYGTSSGNYSTGVDVGKVTTWSVALSTPGKYFFVVQAYNTLGLRSPMSAEVSTTIGSAAPSISSLSPTSGPPGTAVTINGGNFGSSQGTSSVRFNGTTASPTSWSATKIIAAVPSAASSGSVVVTVNGAASNGVAFTVTGGNLLKQPGFEGYTPPSLGTPGWVSDNPLRAIPAKSETNQPHTGSKNGACWATTRADCGIYQEVTAPATGQYTVAFYATADRTGGWVGANVNGQNAAAKAVAASGFLKYQQYVMQFQATAGATIRVWMYSPATPGYVVIDDASLVVSASSSAVIAAAATSTSAQTASDTAAAAAGATPGDYDGDGKTDPTVFRPATGGWQVLASSSRFSTSSSLTWGTDADRPVPGDYDGDGRTDLGFYRPSTGLWSVLLSSTNYVTQRDLFIGIGGDVPVPGDYDGDGKTDVAVYTPATGQWRILRSSADFAAEIRLLWGSGSDIPAPGDYDGDGKTDPAVYQPSSGRFRITLSSTDYATDRTFTLGGAGDVPVEGDFDGDGVSDPAVFQPATGNWLARLSSRAFQGVTLGTLGFGGDVPVPGDYDGDGATDLAVFDAGVWQILYSSRDYTSGVSVTWGQNGDVPAVGGR